MQSKYYSKWISQNTISIVFCETNEEGRIVGDRSVFTSHENGGRFTYEIVPHEHRFFFIGKNTIPNFKDLEKGIQQIVEGNFMSSLFRELLDRSELIMNEKFAEGNDDCFDELFPKLPEPLLQFCLEDEIRSVREFERYNDRRSPYQQF